MEEIKNSWLLFICFVFALFVSGAKSATFTFTNKCSYTVWVGTLNNADKSPLSQAGFEMSSGAAVVLDSPSGWGGRMWGRTGCAIDASGKFTCATGDCGSGQLTCGGAGATPPATLVEFTLGTGGAKDFYDTSLVDGFNLAIGISPQGGMGDCKVSSCPADLNAVCPSELRTTGPDGSTAGCKRACLALGTDQDCCR